MQTILLVEDDPAVRKVLRAMLRGLGYETVEAGNAPEALGFVATYPATIDVLITDVVMPETNCERFVEQIRAERPGVRVIYISGYSEEILGHYGVAHLDSNFIRKPFSAKQLAEKLREVLGVERARSAGASEQR